MPWNLRGRPRDGQRGITDRTRIQLGFCFCSRSLLNFDEGTANGTAMVNLFMGTAHAVA